MKFPDRLRLCAASALDKGTFCIVFSEVDYDDPYSYILVYEEGFEHPWTRFDVPRIIDGVTGKRQPSGKPVFYAKSDEGDVYTLAAGEEPRHFKIAGAGVYSDDATDLGYTNHIGFIGGELFITGYHSQLYHSTEDGWEWFHRAKLPQAPETYDYLVFGKVKGLSGTDIYMNVVYSPTSTNRELTEEEEEEMDRLFLAGKDEEAYAIYEAAEGPSRVDEGHLYHWNGKEWRIVATPRSSRYYPEPAILADIFIETKDRVWAVGQNGVILQGNAEHGFQDVSFKGTSDSLVSITKFQDKMVIASDYGLHVFDGHMLSPLKPMIDMSINKGVPTPLKVQAVDDVLFYFDYKHGVCRFDGKTWDWIDIPPELLKRSFTGLPPRQ